MKVKGSNTANYLRGEWASMLWAELQPGQAQPQQSDFSKNFASGEDHRTRNFIITGCLKFNAAVLPLEQNGSMKYFNLNRPLGITSSLKTHNATLSYAPSTMESPPPPLRDGDTEDFV
jgi:hypothetical protein